MRAPADDVAAALVCAGDTDVPSFFAHSTHNTPPEETFTNVIDRPSVDYLHLDHRLREPLHTDLFPSTPASPTCATTFGDPALDLTPDLGIASDSGIIHTTTPTIQGINNHQSIPSHDQSSNSTFLCPTYLLQHLLVPDGPINISISLCSTN